MTAPRPVYGYTEFGQDPHLLRAANPGQALCDRIVVSVPVTQPQQPAKVCGWCTLRAGKGVEFAVIGPDGDGPWRVAE